MFHFMQQDYYLLTCKSTVNKHGAESSLLLLIERLLIQIYKKNLKRRNNNYNTSRRRHSSFPKISGSVTGILAPPDIQEVIIIQVHN